MANVVEHRVQMQAAPPAGKVVPAAPEKRLNRFVHSIALMERVGNALGTLAFTWATVVVLSGYPTVLDLLDFWFATAIIFLEGLRMFSRSNRLDYQLFFRTRGALRSLGSNELSLLVCFSNVLVCMFIRNEYASTKISPLLVAILAIGPFLCLRLLPSNSLRSAVSLWSPMVAVLLLYPPLRHSIDDHLNIHKLSFRNSIAKWTVYLVLLIVVLLQTISRLQFQSISKLVDWAPGNKTVFWRRIILNLCMFATTVMLMFTFRGIAKVVIIMIDIMALVIVSFGNLQIPAAVLRIVLGLWGGLKVDDHYNDHEHVNKENLGDMKNLVPSLIIFYGMVLGQGILYTFAGILEIFSFILRRSLAHQAGFSGPQGVEYVNSYYAYVFDKCMKGDVLAPKKTSLVTFAVDSLNSDSPEKQLSGLKMLHNFLKKDTLKTKAISELTTSTKTVTCLVNMLGWTSERDKDVRLFATKVAAELADNLRIVPVPGAMQLIGSLLDTAHGLKEGDPLDIDSPEPEQDNLIQQVGGNEQSSWVLKWLKKTAKYCLIPRDEPRNMDEQNPHIFRFWKQSVAKEEPSKDQDLLPVLGMLILDKLASFDLENCIEICRDPGLISMVIEFTSNRPNMTYSNETHNTLLKRSSLKLLRRLASTKGKIGVTLRQKISEHPFLLSNLVEILDNNGSSHELRELTIELLKNVAMEENIKEEIGHIPVIISRLMDAFLSQGAPSSTDSAQLLRMTSGQALAVLAMESANNCLIILAEPHSFIKELTVMIHGDRYRYVASSLLRNMCVHARPELGNSDLKEISYILREVLEGIMDAEGTELEVLVGLSSQICNIIPGDFARELEHGQIKERFMKRLVDALNSNRIPTAHCPGIRRVIVEHAINMMECNPDYASCFKVCRMMEALLMVERTPSRAENYRFFSGNAGLMEHSITLSALVARAKELMAGE